MQLLYLQQQPRHAAWGRSHLDYLDEPKIITQLLDYRHGSSSIITFYVPAIHCSSCIWLLEHLYKINTAIYNSRIDFLKKQVTISFNHEEISLKQLVETLSEIGYTPSISLQDVVKVQNKSVDKSLVLKIAVAGFCMGNVIKLMGKVFGLKLWGLFAGMLNGLIPCGMVYLALATALNTGSTASGATFMFLFGLGTIPLMMMISLGGIFLKKYIRFNTNKLIPWFMLLMGVLFILRSADLGIPFISRVTTNSYGHTISCE